MCHITQCKIFMIKNKRELIKNLNLVEGLPAGTIKKLATLTGYERRTVSLALKGDADVKEDTMLLIVSEAKEIIQFDIKKKELIVSELEGI